MSTAQGHITVSYVQLRSAGLTKFTDKLKSEVSQKRHNQIHFKEGCFKEHAL